jgi:hypothetical protein
MMRKFLALLFRADIGTEIQTAFPWRSLVITRHARGR